MAVRKTKAAKTDQTQISVYLGPSIRGIITKGQVFSGSRENAMSTLPPGAREIPELAALIVDGDKLPEAMLRIRQKGTLLHKHYNTLATRRQ